MNDYKWLGKLGVYFAYWSAHIAATSIKTKEVMDNIVKDINKDKDGKS